MRIHTRRGKARRGALLLAVQTVFSLTAIAAADPVSVVDSASDAGAPTSSALATGGSALNLTTAAPNGNILSPTDAPEIVLKIGMHKTAQVPRTAGSMTTITGQSIANKADTSRFSQVITSSVPGAAQAPSGEMHIRGSHGQYTYYLDGAPLPASVSGSFGDLIDPKNIELLKVYTGGFPASYGGNLAAIFDVTAKAGVAGPPTGFVQQTVEGYQTYDEQGQVSGGDRNFTYLLTGLDESTSRRLDPVTETPIHDGGRDSVAFGKFDLVAGPHDKLVLDLARSSDFFALPNTPDRQAVGQNDNQAENGDLGNLIWHHSRGSDNLNMALYSHQSQLRYFGSPGDLIPSAGTTSTAGLVSATENRTDNYVGLRTDYSDQVSSRNKLGLGEDLDYVTGHEYFLLLNGNDANGNPVPSNLEDQNIAGSDRSVYLQDDLTPGRWLIDYGLRYDEHVTDTVTSQVSPRFNAYYTAGPQDKLHAFYDRLFQPAPIEDILHLIPGTIPFKPERDNFYEVGWEHDFHNITSTLNTYYKTEQDVIDENILPGTEIPEPFNVQFGYVRGIEAAVNGPLNPEVSFYANFARSWAKSEGDFTGGFVPVGSSPSWFYDDHDQTNTASVGATYERPAITVDLDGEYGSGFPYGQNAAGQQNVYRLPPHFIFNSEVGTSIRKTSIDFTVDNLLNHPYIIKQADVFVDTEWGQARTYGVRVTQHF